jgi:cysteine desulfurase/selenocysteine lyase
MGVTATSRASFYVYNEESDIDALIAGLRTAGDLFGVG